MALPKAKVKERLKAKFPGVNLAIKRIDAIADKLKLPEDADDEAIDDRLDELNDVFSFADMAKNDDRLRTEAEKKKKEDQPDNQNPKPSDENPKPETDIAKILADALAPLVAKINSLESGKIGDSRKTQLDSILKDVNPKYKDSMLKSFARMKFEKDEDWEEYISEVEEDAKDFIQSEVNEGLGKYKPPVQGKDGGQKKQASKEEVDAVLNSIL